MEARSTSDLLGIKIGLMLNDDFSMLHFRGGLIRHLLARGADMVVFVPQGEFCSELTALGAKVVPIPIGRNISPLSDLKLILYLIRVLRHEHLDLLHTMTVKPNIFGAFSAWLAGVPKTVGLVSGAGMVFSKAPNIKHKLSNWITRRMYQFAFLIHRKVWFQNPDDAQEFVARHLLPKRKIIVIRSGGIDTQAYSREALEQASLADLRSELCISPNQKCIVMIARMIWSKGVREFIDAASKLQEFQDWKFVMLCPWDPLSPDHIDEDYLENIRLPNLVAVTQFRKDVKSFAGIADIGVLPSYYREGVPRSLLEFISLGVPIVTTDSSGCREVVLEGTNGFQIPIKDHMALADRLRRLMTNDLLRQDMGNASRRLALDEFSEAAVTARIVAEVYEIGNASVKFDTRTALVLK